MKNLLNHQEGYTLIELLVALAIVGILSSAIGSFIITHIRAYHRTQNHMEVQYQAQIAMNVYVDKIRESEGITFIAGEHNWTDNKSELKDPLYVSVLKLFREVEKEDGETKQVIWELNYNKSTKAVLYGDESPGYSNNIFAEYIDSVVLEPLPTDPDTSFQNAEGIRISITSKKEEATITLETDVYFRNHD